MTELSDDERDALRKVVAALASARAGSEEWLDIVLDDPQMMAVGALGLLEAVMGAIDETLGAGTSTLLLERLGLAAA